MTDGDGHDHGDGGDHSHDDHAHDHGEGHTHHGHADEDHHAHDPSSVGVAVVTVSTSRTIEDDDAGDAVVAAMEDAGHEVPVRELIDDDFDGVQRTLLYLVDREDVDAVVTTGGTGVSPDDVTVEAAEDLFEKALPGVGEYFRRLSHEEVGAMAVASRATAGVLEGVVVFCLPGSENAATLGARRVVRPVVGHLVGQARVDGD